MQILGRQLSSPATAGISAQSGPSARESASTPLAGKLIADGVSEQDRKALLGHLGKLPQGALEKLVDEGWSVSTRTAQVKSDGTKDGGGCDPYKRTIGVDAEILHSPKGGRVVLHEAAHALDFKGSTPPKGMLGRLLSKAGRNGGQQMQFHSNQDARMAQTFQSFQARNLAEVGAKVLAEAKVDTGAAPQALNFKTDFHGQGQVVAHNGQVIVQTDNSEAARQQKFGLFEVQDFGLPADSRHQVNGAEVGLRVDDQNKTAIFAQEDAPAFRTSWTDNGDYVAASNLPSEMYAEAVAAYLDTSDSRQALAQEAPELHALVQESLNEYLIAK